MRSASLRIVPGTVAAVDEFCLVGVPTATFNLRIDPLVQVPAAAVPPICGWVCGGLARVHREGQTRRRLSSSD
jgi:hypothetical protein